MIFNNQIIKNKLRLMLFLFDLLKFLLIFFKSLKIRFFYKSKFDFSFESFIYYR